MKMTRRVEEEIFENDYVRLLLTKNFPKKNKKNRKKILMDIVSSRG
jgi:hypothetical protein